MENEGSDQLAGSPIRGTRARFVDLACVAGFVPPTAMTDWFFALQLHLFDGAPPSLAHLREPRPGGPDWLARVRSGVLDSVQEGLYASLYHLERVEYIENQMLGIAEQHVPSLEMPPGSCAAGGNTRALDCEYQAFAFASRRTLEYIAVAAAAYFKRECHSIRKLRTVLLNALPSHMAARLDATLAARLDELADILSEDKHNDRSLRDRSAHWENVRAGSFNVSRVPWGYEIAFIGGGHELPTFRGRENVGSPPGSQAFAYAGVGPALRDQFVRVERTVYDVLEALDLLPPSDRAPAV